MAARSIDCDTATFSRTIDGTAHQRRRTQYSSRGEMKRWSSSGAAKGDGNVAAASMMTLSSDGSYWKKRGVEWRVSMFYIDPGTGERLGLLTTSTVGDGSWVDLTEPIIVRAGEAFVAVPEPAAER
jgi:hypothetical protein